MSTNTKVEMLADELREDIAGLVRMVEDHRRMSREAAAGYLALEKERDALREAIAAHDAEQAAKAVPAGFVLVPVEPTLEMLTAAGREDDKAFIDGMPHGATAADTWAAMLAAAPTPPAPDCED